MLCVLQFRMHILCSLVVAVIGSKQLYIIFIFILYFIWSWTNRTLQFRLPLKLFSTCFFFSLSLSQLHFRCVSIFECASFLHSFGSLFEMDNIWGWSDFLFAYTLWVNLFSDDLPDSIYFFILLLVSCCCCWWWCCWCIRRFNFSVGWRRKKILLHTQTIKYVRSGTAEIWQQTASIR